MEMLRQSWRDAIIIAEITNMRQNPEGVTYLWMQEEEASPWSSGIATDDFVTMKFIPWLREEEGND